MPALCTPGPAPVHPCRAPEANSNGISLAGAGNCVTREPAIPRKTLPVRRGHVLQCLHRESAQQGKVRLLSTKMDCNLPPLMREEQHVSTRSLTPLLMLENPEDLSAWIHLQTVGLGKGKEGLKFF